MTSMPYSSVSLPMARPTCSTKSVFQLEARQVPMGNPVAKNVCCVLSRWASICTPAGPSATTVAGMPSRGMATVVPAAPATSFFWCPSMAPEPTKESLPPPTSSWAFSSSVMAFNTSSMLSAFSFTCAVIVVIVSMAARPVINCFFMLIYMLISSVS